MPVTSSSVGLMQLDELVEGVHAIYGSKDFKRSLWDVWMHTNHHAAAIAEEVRKGGAEKLLTETADCTMWLFTMVKKLQGQIGIPKPPSDSRQESLIRTASTYSDMLWSKFPGICPLCYWRRVGGDRDRERQSSLDDPCDCLPYDVEKPDPMQKRQHATALRAFSREHAATKPSGVDEWQRMFARIFAANLRRLDPSQIVLHLLEEMGEVSDALARTYSYKDTDFVAGEPLWRQIWLEEQLADVSSWLFALVEKLDSTRDAPDERARRLRHWADSSGGRVLLSQVIWRRYGSDQLKDFACWKCKEQNCSCQIILVPPDRSVEDLRALIGSTKKSETE
jgi:NTP pyrophosphatase (non-canonical NTP hydrolase)